jgi:hypothetical protein
MLAPAAGRAAVAQWTGDFSGTWGTASSWSGGVVPNNTQSVTYLVTVAQQVGIYANVTISSSTPTVEVDQLTLRPTGSVNIASGSTLRLRDIGAEVNLQRSLVGGGTLQIASGGTLQVALNGSVISGNNTIQMNGGRIAGTGRIENSRIISGQGTIGNAAGAFDALLVINNVGSNSGLFASLSADRSGQTLTLGPGGATGDIGIRNNYAKLTATNGGTLIIRGNGMLLDNTNGSISPAVSSEVRLVNGVAITGGSLGGVGTIRVPGGEAATLTSVDMQNSATTIEGTLTTHGSTANGGTVVLRNKIVANDFTNQSGGTINLQFGLNTPSITPTLDFTSSLLINSGTISGVGKLMGETISNSGVINAAVPGGTLTLDVNNVALGPNGSLANNRALLVVGSTAATGILTGTSPTPITTSAASITDLNLAATLPTSTITNLGNIRIYKPATLGTIAGDTGNLTVKAATSTTAIRNGAFVESGLTVRSGSGVSRGSSLIVQGSNGTLDLTDNAWIVDYAADATSPLVGLRPALTSGKVFSSISGRRVGVVEASAIGSPATWFGETIDASAILLRSTFGGDADVDGTVDFADLVRLAQNYGLAQKTWSDGDFDYDGNVDFDDLVSLAQNYSGTAIETGAAGGDDFAADWALAQSLVPEPGSLSLLAALGLITRRGRVSRLVEFSA